MKTYYYISGNTGMTSSGSFSKIKSNWIVFTQEDVNTIGDNKPYSATKKGVFIETNKYW